MQPVELDELVQNCVVLAKRAGEAILPYWQQWFTLSVQRKKDQSPVTVADFAAHQVLLAGLQELTPDWPVLSEEGEQVSFHLRKHWQYYWLLDPLDGTRGFIKGSPEFTVNIALIYNHTPILGVIYAPVSQLCYYAHHKSHAFKQEKNQSVMTLPQQHQFSSPWRLAIGQQHRQQPLEQKIPNNWSYTWLRLNSSLKFCLLAEDKADAYIRFGPTCEWDTAAGQCILQQTGGATVDLSGLSLQYNRKLSLLNPNFIAIADVSFLASWLNVLNKENNDESNQ